MANKQYKNHHQYNILTQVDKTFFKLQLFSKNNYQFFFKANRTVRSDGLFQIQVNSSKDSGCLKHSQHTVDQRAWKYFSYWVFSLCSFLHSFLWNSLHTDSNKEIVQRSSHNTVLLMAFKKIINPIRSTFHGWRLEINENH